MTGWNNPTSNIDTSVVTEFGYVYKFLNPLTWSKLIPDTTHALVASSGSYANPPQASGIPGGSCPSSGFNILSNSYVTAGKSANGKLAVAYLPASTTVTVAMGQMGATPTAQWYDPTKDPTLGGSYTTICSPIGTPCNAGSQNMTPPGGAHADGSSDWVLKITASPM
jgi:hypothetical protein